MGTQTEYENLEDENEALFDRLAALMTVMRGHVDADLAMLCAVSMYFDEWSGNDGKLSDRDLGPLRASVERYITDCQVAADCQVEL